MIVTTCTVAFNDSFIILSDKMIIYDKCVTIESRSIVYRDVKIVRRVRCISQGCLNFIIRTYV